MKERIAPYIIDPMNRYKVLWDLSLGFVYLMSYLLDPFVLGFHFTPLQDKVVVILQEAVTCVMAIDILVSMVTGI